MLILLYERVIDQQIGQVRLFFANESSLKLEIKKGCISKALCLEQGAHLGAQVECLVKVALSFYYSGAKVSS